MPDDVSNNSARSQPTLRRRSLLKLGLLGVGAVGGVGLVSCSLQPDGATADTYLSADPNGADENFSSEPQLLVANPVDGSPAMALLCLEIGALAAEPSALRLSGQNNKEWAAMISVYDVAALTTDPTTIDLSTITWNNRPDLAQLVTSKRKDGPRPLDQRRVDGPVTGTYEWDVSAAVAAARHRGQPTVSLALTIEDQSSVSFGSLENTDPQRMPPALLAEQATPESRIAVQAKRKTTSKNRTYLAKTVDGLPATVRDATPPPTGRYGGRTEVTLAATGFFRTQRGGDDLIGDSWTLVDPDGHPFYSIGITSVRPPEGESAPPANWPTQVLADLREAGFNCTGAFCDDQALRGNDHQLPFAPTLAVLNSFALDLGLARPGEGNYKFVADSLPVWHPEFPAAARNYLGAELPKFVGNPWLIGHHLDNELAADPDSLKNLLTGRKGGDDPRLAQSREEAWKWITAQRNGRRVRPDKPKITDTEAAGWLGYVYDRYYQVVAPIYRELAPQHLLLGTRMHARAIREPAIVAAAGRYADILSFNYYGRWGVRRAELDMWRQVGPNTPALITEFYAKGADTGLAAKVQDGGAGWIVPTQADRGRYYENTTIDLLMHPHTIGWTLFKLQDAPDESNKGVLASTGQVYQDYRRRLARQNSTAYAVRDHFHRKK